LNADRQVAPLVFGVSRVQMSIVPAISPASGIIRSRP
jgi:hypothetical protein